MKGLMDEYGTTMVYVIIGFVVITISWFLINTSAESNIPNIPNDEHISSNADYKTKPRPIFKMGQGCKAEDSDGKAYNCGNLKINKGDDFDAMLTPEVEVFYYENPDDANSPKVDITNRDDEYVYVKHFDIGDKIDTNVPGVYALRYVAMNEYGMRSEAKVRVLVE